MKKYHAALMLVGTLVINNIIADEIQEIVITSSHMDHALNEVENPLHVVSGGDISDTATESLGASLDNLLGVSSADYGSGVGQPIIRGMSGNRVKILSNGIVVRDVSGLGADHINDVDLNNIQQIEVVVGPSSLLYSNGTVGGIINVVDNTIARQDFLDSELRVGLELQSVNDGNAHALSYQNNIGGLNLSLAYKDTQFGDFDIPMGAVLHAEDDHDEDLSYLPNSDHESNSKRFGLSKTGDWGYFGFSLNTVESLYGIPVEGASLEDEPAGERIFITTNSDAFNLEGSYAPQQSWLKKVDYFFRKSDYSLTEQHAVEGGYAAEEGPTLFKNDATEYGVVFDLTNESFTQRGVVNFVDEDISIVGAEAYMNPAKNEETSFGYYLSKELDSLHLDFGVRHDRVRRQGSVSHEGQLEYFDENIRNTSFAFSSGMDINESWNLSLAVASVERAPSAVELFMNGPHLASGRFVVGKVDLRSETSNNIDLSLSYENNGLFGVVTLFKNNVDNYIYLMDETAEDHMSLILTNYQQKDARIEGYEFEFGKVFELERGNLSLSYGRDSISGEFKDGSNVRRMTPTRNIYSVSYAEDDLEFQLHLKDIEDQQDIGLKETATAGYQMIDVLLKRTIDLSADNELSVSLFANNLLNEIARNHASFVKDQVPLSGRNYGMRLNFTF